MIALTPDAIQKTRQHFHDNALACIAEVKSGAIVLPSHVSQESYFAHRRAEADAWMRGDYDRSLTFRQYATWVQTGKCVALLP